MGSMVVLALGIVAAGIFLGFIIGKVNARAQAGRQLQEAFQRGKEEAEVEKANLGAALGEELLKLRDGIQTLAQSYESTVRLVHERLGDSMKTAAIELNHSPETQLSLDFARAAAEAEQSTLAAPEPLAPAEEPKPAEIVVSNTTGADRIEIETIVAESVDEHGHGPLGGEGFGEPANGREKGFTLQ